MSESYIREVEMLREGERAADAEIERLREVVIARDAEIKALRDSIPPLIEDNERLREENSTFSDSLAAKADRIDRLGEAVARQVAEIERLRDRVRRITEQRDGLLLGLDQKDGDIERLRAELQAILANGVRVRIPTETMEAEITAHVRRAVKEKNLEIERLRESVKFLNSFRPDAALAKRDAEIERLRGEVKLMRQMDAPTLAAIEKRDAEIERLRGALEAITIVPVGEGAAGTMRKLAVQALR